ncbi:MAG: sigma-70 family RNA polymerase sigma factor [Planctomycetales bacterium]|nr:sigma-70 family RNA polymerase sigma factor [Planctomycetales bacterium]
MSDSGADDSHSTDNAQEQISKILTDASPDTHKAEQLLPIVYDQLRAIAKRRLQAERTDHTLQATALVHEAYCRLVGDRKIPWGGPGHFYAAAAEAMRRILLDHAKSRKRQKRGGERKKVPLNVVDLAACDNYEEIVALDDAYRRLEQQNPEAAAVVKLRFYGGLSVKEVADALDLSPRTVDRRWMFARAWLFKAMQESEHDT